LSGKLKYEDVLPGSTALMAWMIRPTTEVVGFGYLPSLGEALGSLSGKLKSEDVLPFARALVARMTNAATQSYELASLGKALGSLSGNLKPENVVPLATALVERMTNAAVTEGFELAALGSVLGSLSGKLKVRGCPARGESAGGADDQCGRRKATNGYLWARLWEFECGIEIRRYLRAGDGARRTDD
jgi:hypothetical protein